MTLEPGQVVLLAFPNTNLSPGKSRPALLLARIPGRHGDWLACMVSSRLYQAAEGFDDVVTPADDDFASSGLRAASVIRLGRMAVIQTDLIAGVIGSVAAARCSRLRRRLSDWLSSDA